MNIAIINGKRTTAFSGGKAACPFCDAPVIAKCGPQRVDHWAHKGSKSCNLGKENETEWHRSWKNKFPPEFQEFIQYDSAGEKHIADVRTTHGLVIEFQHSHLDPKERDARERFYKNMVWVVDGTRLKRDYPRFQKGIGSLITTKRDGKILVRNPEICFPVDWLNSSVQVFFDFLGVVLTDAPEAQRQPLWCLHPKRDGWKRRSYRNVTRKLCGDCY